jgi:hypothetical protein
MTTAIIIVLTWVLCSFSTALTLPAREAGERDEIARTKRTVTGSASDR